MEVSGGYSEMSNFKPYQVTQQLKRLVKGCSMVNTKTLYLNPARMKWHSVDVFTRQKVGDSFNYILSPIKSFQSCKKNDEW